MQQKLRFYHIWFPKYNVRQVPLFFQSKKKNFRKLNFFYFHFQDCERGKTLEVRACRKKIILVHKLFHKLSINKKNH